MDTKTFLNWLEKHPDAKLMCETCGKKLGMDLIVDGFENHIKCMKLGKPKADVIKDGLGKFTGQSRKNF